MASPDTAKPAREVSAEPVSNVEQLGSGLNQSNTPNASKPQAAPDDHGEDDLTFFSRRPNVNTRTRLPIAGEFPPGVIDARRVAFVHVVTLRDPLTNQPTTRGRGVFYADSSDEGGRA
jgi:hypothetical protein